MAKKKKFGELDYHEVLDRSYLLFNTWAEFIIEHQVTGSDKELKEQAEKVLDEMWKFYTLVATKY